MVVAGLRHPLDFWDPGRVGSPAPASRFSVTESSIEDPDMSGEVKAPTPVGPIRLNDAVRSLIVEAVNRPGNVVIITGAGVSAESGIPIYRGAKGLWTEEGGEAIIKATAGFFVRHRRESWAWYLERRTEARKADPNIAHFAIAEIGRLLDGRFTLIAQNIDRLHARAASRAEEMIELHGHLEGMRCIEGCSGVFAIPEAFDQWTSDDSVGDGDLRLLTCPLCGLPARPHVLWFDEFYDEANYGFATAQRAVANATLCITVGTSGGIPVAGRLAGIAARAGATLIDINTRDNPLRRLAAHHGGFIEGSATATLQAVAAIVREETAGAVSDRKKDAG